MTANLFWRFPLRYGLHRMISVVKTDSTITARVPHRYRDHTACWPPPRYSMTVAFLVKEIVTYKSCVLQETAMGQKGTVLIYWIYILAQMISTLLIYTSRSTSQHQQEQQHKYRSGHVATQTPDTSLSHLGKEKKKFSHQSEAANC